MVRVATVDGQIHNFNVQTVKQLSQLCAQFVAPEQQIFINNGQQLDMDAAVPEFVCLRADVDGGAKKKKKVYTKPKKTKHKNKKIKLRVLNLYKVEATGLVRLRKECKTCGGATFMASHKDRYYCGSCHATIARKD